ncbi:MAG: SWIM zinc finger family protein [Pseudomonadota bacterium]
MASIDHVYRYAQPSTLEKSGAAPTLRLVAQSQASDSQRYFVGRLNQPLVAALGLRAVSNLVGTRFYIPPNMRARLIAEADPVVTVSAGRVRFEGFSACCSAYVRHDLAADSFEAEHIQPGTTNVDFGTDMRAALATVRTNDALHLAVDEQAVELATATESVIERKVPLPLRWIRGFAEVQSHLVGMAHSTTLKTIDAQRFLRAVPRAQADHEQWLVTTGRSVRLSPRARKDAVMVRGTQRLRVLEPLVAAARALEIWFNDEQRSSAWVLNFGTQRLTLVLNSEPWRGFSGDGQVLTDVTASQAATVAAVTAQLAWQSDIDSNALSGATGFDSDAVTAALSTLAAQGHVGFDLATQRYFHRVLPFDLGLIERLNPRLKSAQTLHDSGAVTLRATDSGYSADVRSDSVVHRIDIDPTGARCTCPWYAKHQGRRGPCKHILATQLAIDAQ